VFNKKIIIVGKSGSGKDYLMDSLDKENMVKCLKYTTRPIRKNEKHNITYHYTNNKKFEHYIKNNEMVIYQKIEITSSLDKPIWYYGITLDNFNTSDFMVMTPHEINSYLKNNQRDSIFVIYLDIDKDVRKKRVINRNDHSDSVSRRFIGDDIDFKDFNIYDLQITDTFFDTSNIIDIIKNSIKRL
jgi:guanylate kinase